MTLAAIGGGDVSASEWLTIFKPSATRQVSEEDAVEELVKKGQHKPTSSGRGQVEVNGVGNLQPYRPLLSAVPGDEIFRFYH